MPGRDRRGNIAKKAYVEADIVANRARIGSSFAFITAMSLAMKEMGGDVSAAQTQGYLDWFGLCPCGYLVFVLQVQNGLINSCAPIISDL